MKRVHNGRFFPLTLAICLVAIMACDVVWAQEETPDTRRWGFEVGVQGLLYDNFFEVPSGVSQTDVQALNASLEARFHPESNRPIEFFGSVGDTSYTDNLGDSPAVGLGIRWNGRPARGEVSAEYEADRPTVDVGDTLGLADTTKLNGEYGYRFGDNWEVTGRARYQNQSFQRVQGRDNDFTSIGGALRYRGWGYDFSPEVGVDFGTRNATDPNEDLDQKDYWIQLRSIPTDGLYLSLRYRYRVRDYSIGDALASNFNRQDDRQQIALTVDYRLTEPWSVGGYYAYQNADSTNPNRVFKTQLFVVGTKFRF